MKKILKSFDDFQYHNKVIGFIVAVIRHYSSDQAGRQAALITYYLFLSLFPLLLGLSLLSNWLNRYYPGIATSLVHGATNYFPVLGKQLYTIAHSAHTSISGILSSGLVALYGARGVALAFRTIVNDCWGVPTEQRGHFPSTWIKGLTIVIIGGLGFVLTAVATSWALSQDQNDWLSVAVSLIGFILLTGVFVAILKLSLPSTFKVKKVLTGALSMALALSLLQLIGGFIVTHDLKHYTNTYTALFGTALGLLAWIYIVAQILIYSIEITVVADRHLWPVRLFKSQK